MTIIADRGGLPLGETGEDRPRNNILSELKTVRFGEHGHTPLLSFSAASLDNYSQKLVPNLITLPSNAYPHA